MEQTNKYDEKEELKSILKPGPEVIMVDQGLNTALYGVLGGIITNRSIKKMSNGKGGLFGLFIGTLCIGSSIKSGIDCFKVAKYLHNKHQTEKLGKNASEVKADLIAGKADAEDVEFEVQS